MSRDAVSFWEDEGVFKVVVSDKRERIDLSLDLIVAGFKLALPRANFFSFTFNNINPIIDGGFFRRVFIAVKFKLTLEIRIGLSVEKESESSRSYYFVGENSFAVESFNVM